MLLKTENLDLELIQKNEKFYFLNDINISIGKGKGVALVGESGSGKTLLALSLIKLNPSNSRLSGKILYKDIDVLNLKSNEIRKMRGNEIGIIFQEAIHSFNPIYKIGTQMDETLKYNSFLSKGERIKKIEELLSSLGFWDSKVIMKMYPHQLSGGMIQRVLMAQSLILNPNLLIADEPSSSLDLTSKKYILELLYKKVRLNNMSLFLITHNFTIIPKLTDYVYVMYGGMIVEEGKTEEIIKNPLHPYTQNLLKEVPALLSKNESLLSQNYLKPVLNKKPDSCSFRENCKKSCKNCFLKIPKMKKINNNQKVRCFLYE